MEYHELCIMRQGGDFKSLRVTMKESVRLDENGREKIYIWNDLMLLCERVGDREREGQKTTSGGNPIWLRRTYGIGIAPNRNPESRG